MKTAILITIIFLSNYKPIITACRQAEHEVSMGDVFNRINDLRPPKCFLAHYKYHYYRVTNGLESLSPIWESLTDLENAIKELEQ